MSANKTNSKQQVLDDLYRQGKTLKSWCEENGYGYGFVSGILNGRSKALRGKGLEAAIKLGFKAA